MSSQHPDFKWIEQLHFGNEEAYRILFDEYYQMLGVFAMKYVNYLSLPAALEVL